MKIVRLEAENVKRLRCIEITPEGNVVIVGGKNGAGKTSVLDAITYALAGKGAVCDQPVKRGTAKAAVNIDLGEFHVRRTFTAAGGGTLTITASDGTKAASPQALLDKITGKLTFDPLAFASMPVKPQLEALRDLVGLDFAELDAKRKDLYDERTLAGRDVTGRQKLIDGMPEYAEAPGAEISVARLSADLEAATELNRRQGDVRRQCRQALGVVVANEGRVIEVQTKLACMEKNLEESQEVAARLSYRVDALVDRDTTTIYADIAEAEEINKKVRANAAKQDRQKCFDEAQVEYAKLTDSIDKIDCQKQAAVANAKFPIDGLTFDETGVLFNGIPFSQSSSAEQVRVSVAMALAVNPTLKIALIRDGSLLDDGSLRMIAEMAEKADAQVWIEVVSTDAGKCSVIIEDGRVKEKEAKP